MPGIHREETEENSAPILRQQTVSVSKPARSFGISESNMASPSALLGNATVNKFSTTMNHYQPDNLAKSFNSSLTLTQEVKNELM